MDWTILLVSGNLIWLRGFMPRDQKDSLEKAMLDSAVVYDLIFGVLGLSLTALFFYGALMGIVEQIAKVR